MKLIIAGGRDYELTVQDYSKLNRILPRVTEIVSGGARGADACGELWATLNHITLKRFPADWKRYGKRAGMLRNEQMGKYADAVALFPGGKGTQNMFKIAKRNGLQIFDFRTNTLL